MTRRHARTHTYDHETRKDTHMHEYTNTKNKGHARVKDERRWVRGSAGYVIHVRRRPVDDTPCHALNHVRPSVFLFLIKLMMNLAIHSIIKYAPLYGPMSRDISWAMCNHITDHSLPHLPPLPLSLPIRPPLYLPPPLAHYNNLQTLSRAETRHTHTHTHTHTYTHTRTHRWLKSAGERERELAHMAAP